MIRGVSLPRDRQKISLLSIEMKGADGCGMESLLEPLRKGREDAGCSGRFALALIEGLA